VKHLLYNPVHNALCSGDKHLCFGTDSVRFFDEQVSPFVGFEESYSNGFDELHALLPTGRKILFATPGKIMQPAGWQLLHEIKGLQFVYDAANEIEHEHAKVRPLTDEHIDQMMLLALLTKPGPFGRGTINFGYYHGIFDDDKLVAMTGQRLHVHNFTEISAVCTHPDHTGNGYAYALLIHQIKLILQQGQRPFLHVREDNRRAIELYQRIGFTISRQMNFYFMKRR
jgi:ribosomal protein S18 acetylase RimI-like enzyme